MLILFLTLFDRENNSAKICSEYKSNIYRENQETVEYIDDIDVLIKCI